MTPPLYMKKTSMSKMIFRPFGAKKNWIWKMTLADSPSPPSMEFSIILFFNPSLTSHIWVCRIHEYFYSKLRHPKEVSNLFNFVRTDAFQYRNLGISKSGVLNKLLFQDVNNK